MLEKTVKCPICGRPYKIMPYCAGDQSACLKCVAEAERNMGGGDWRPIFCNETDDQKKIREDIDRRYSIKSRCDAQWERAEREWLQQPL